HLARHGAVELRDRVRVLRRAERKRREPESVFARRALAEREELLPAEAAALDEPAEGASHELRIEHLVASRHRCVRREDRGGAEPLERFVRRQALLLHELAHALELEERGVALVQVENRRLE